MPSIKKKKDVKPIIKSEKEKTPEVKCKHVVDMENDGNDSDCKISS